MSGSPTRTSLEAYKSLFLSHLTSTQSHDNDRSLISSVHPPNAYWSTVEKNRFFHGLSRYSKLRPDLISSHIGGNKTAVDVVGYIGALEEGVKGLGRSREKKKPAKGAHIVSDRWIKFEEDMAQQLRLQEEEWQESSLEVQREAALKKAKNRKRKRDEIDEKYEKEWKREDVMELLGRRELQTLDLIIRRATEQTTEQTRRQSNSPKPESSSTPNPTIRDTQERAESQPPIDDSTLTPLERQRLRKRLWMRKKRAEEAGKVADETQGRLKPGRKTTRPQPFDAVRQRTASTSPSRERVEAASDQEERESQEEGGAKYRPRGLTPAQRMQREFEELGVNIDFIEESGMEMFNLAKLENLWMLLTDQQPARNISYLTIRVLRACLENFVIDAVEKIITIAEMERRLKEHTKVWKGQFDEIKAIHVTQALSYMRLPYHTEKSNALARREAEMQGRDEEEATSAFASILGLDIHPDLIYHPALLGKPEILVEDSIVIALGDEEESRAEQMADLAEDLKLDADDKRGDARHEASLWELVGKSTGKGKRSRNVVARFEKSRKRDDEEEEGDASGDNVEDRPAKNYRDVLRYRPAGGTVKSQPFIFSDDEEEY